MEWFRILCSKNPKCWLKCFPMPAFLLIALKEHRKGQPQCLEQLLCISFFFFSLNHFYKSVCWGLCKELNNEKGILFEIIYLEIGLINSLYFWSYILCRCKKRSESRKTFVLQVNSRYRADAACLNTSKFPIPPLRLCVKSGTDLSAWFLGQLRGIGDMWHSIETTGSLDFPVSSKVWP